MRYKSIKGYSPAITVESWFQQSEWKHVLVKIYLEVSIFPARFLGKNSDQDLRWSSFWIHTLHKLPLKHNKIYINIQDM